MVRPCSLHRTCSKGPSGPLYLGDPSSFHSGRLPDVCLDHFPCGGQIGYGRALHEHNMSCSCVVTITCADVPTNTCRHNMLTHEHVSMCRPKNKYQNTCRCVDTTRCVDQYHTTQNLDKQNVYSNTTSKSHLCKFHFLLISI